MATTHSLMSGDELHEPKGVDSASVDTVYKADGAGSGDWSFIDWEEVTNKEMPLVFQVGDISTAQSAYVASPYTGTITKAWSVIDGTIASGDATLTLKINGVAVTDGTITIANAGSAAGDVDSCTPSANNTVSPGDTIEVETDGGSTNSVIADITIIIEV